MNPVPDLPALRDALADADGRLLIAQAEQQQLTAEADSVAAVRVQVTVAKAQRDVDRARDHLIAAETAPPADDHPDQNQDPPAPERRPAFSNVGDFVDAYLLEHWRRQNITWCATWWRHSEAIDRLRALWLAWEASRYEGPMAMAVWWRDFADPFMADLTSTSGPFAQCDHTNGHRTLLKRAAVQTPPDGLLST